MKKVDPKQVFAVRLAQARRMRGLSLRELSRATGDRVSYNALHRYEQGEMMPSDDVLISVADSLDKPLDYFFRPFSVKLQGIQFRKRTKLGVKEEEAIKEKATEFLERYLEVEQILGLSGFFRDPLGKLRLTKIEDAEEAAEKVRDEWKLGLDPLPNVIETLEIHGIKVYQVGAPESFDGFSGWADGNPVVVLARWLDRDVPRKRFSALHEAAHVLLHPHCDTPTADREKCCHRFAGAMLMPREVFMRDWGGYRRRIALGELQDLKRRYGMSMAAIMGRAKDLNLVSSELYTNFQIVRKTKGWHLNEPGEYPDTEKSTRFEQLTLRALSEEAITINKGAALLNEPVEILSRRLSEFA